MSAPREPLTADRPVLLALDTATERLAIGLQVGQRRWSLDEPGGARASSRLIPALQGLLDAAGIGREALQAIAFGRGPGAFTGLRTACAVAQGLAFGLGRPVLAVDSLLIVAEALRDVAPPPDGGAVDRLAGDWWVAMDARMDEVYAAQYRCGPDPAPSAAAWSTLRPPRLYTLAALGALWADEPPQRVVGNAVAAFGDRLAHGGALIQPEPGPRAEALLRLAEAAWLRGEAQPPDGALPHYLRDKVALTTEERLLARAAGPLRP